MPHTGNEPITDDIDRLLERLHSLTDDQIWLLADLWQSEDTGARGNAWASAKAAIAEAGHERILDEVREAVAGWMRADRSDFQGIGGLLGRAAGAAGGRQAAAPAIIDAAAGILAAARLDEGDRAVLSRPWEAIRDAGEG